MSVQRAGSTERTLRDFIVTELVEEPFEGTDPLAAGAVDSLAVEQLLDYIHELFGVELADEEINYDNFESVATLAALVDAKSGRPLRSRR